MNLANKYECECDANHHGVHCNSTHDDCDTDLDELCGVGVLACNNLEREHENDREAYECTCKDGYDVIHNKCVRGARARSVRILIISLKYYCITHEFEKKLLPSLKYY